MKNVSAFLFPLLACLSAFGAQEKPPESLTPAVITSFVDRAKALKLHESPQWLRLVHYEKGLFGWESEADSSNFFVSPDGKTNPDAELEATLRGFFSTDKRTLEGVKQPKQSVRCQFPARYAWLDSQLGLAASVPSETCPEFEDYRTRMAVKSATHVFSSFYVGNPSSTFGHSLVRLNKSDGADGSEHHQLLDFGVNYAANPTTDNPILYALMGLAGLFPGTFTSLPYYYKVREYADFQSRDVWEYDLDLTPAEIDRLVAHTWELGSTYFDYYYLTENCSYHMLTLIDAAAPRYSLVDKIPYWVLPTDTVKATFEEDGLVKRTSFRPSIHTQFLARLALLDAEEKRILNATIDEDGANAPALTNAKVMDAYIDYFDLHHAESLVHKIPDVTKRKQALLVARSRLPVSETLSFDPPPSASPHLAHDSFKMSFLAFEDDLKGSGGEFGARFAFHDLLDPVLGLPDNADIEFVNVRMRHWNRTGRVQLEDLALFGVGTYQSIDAYTQKASWRTRTGVRRIDDFRCQNCEAAYFHGGAGLTTNLFAKGQLIYLLGEAQFETSPRFEPERFTTAYGPTVGVRLMAKPYVSLKVEGRYVRNANFPDFEDRILDTHLRLYPRAEKVTWGFDAHTVHKRASREVSVGLVHYF